MTITIQDYDKTNTNDKILILNSSDNGNGDNGIGDNGFGDNGIGDNGIGDKVLMTQLVTIFETFRHLCDFGRHYTNKFRHPQISSPTSVTNGDSPS